MVQKIAVKREFEAGLRRATTGKLSVNPAVNGYLFRIRKGKGSERRGMGSAFHQLCPRYSGTLTPTVPMAIRLWETFTFTTRLVIHRVLKFYIRKGKTLIRLCGRTG